MWKAILAFFGFGIPIAVKARRQVAKDKAKEKQDSLIALRDRLRGKVDGK